MKALKTSCLFISCLLVIVLSSCSGAPVTPITLPSEFTAPPPAASQSAASQGQESPATSAPTATTENIPRLAASEIPDPLIRLLDLRGISFSLSGTRPDGSTQSISGEIDATGNMHLAYAQPPVILERDPTAGAVVLDGMNYEVFVIDGKAYIPSTGDPSWANNPAEEDYLPTLSNQLHDLESFTLWLDLLPKGSLTAAGSEQSGGFSLDKYTVNGPIGDQVITGTLWYDQATHAMVKSELRVPVALDSDPEAPEAGEIVITLSTTKADVSPITIPTDDQAAPQPTALLDAFTTTAQAPLSDEPTVINTFSISDMPYHPGGAGGVVLALPGQVWTADMFSGLQLHNPQTGALMKTIPLEARLYHDLKLVNQRLWVLATKGEDENHADVLYVLDLPSGEVVETFPITKLGSYGFEPTELGVSPGKVWVNSGVVDTGKLEFTAFPDGLPSGARFAYDGANWMWITGSWCYACEHDLWIMDAVNPPAHKDAQKSGVLGTGTLGSPLALAGGRMWVLTRYYVANNPTYYLDAYDLDKTDLPALHIDVTAEIGDSNRDGFLVADNHMLWMEVKGKLYYYDNLTGEKKGELPPLGEFVESMSFDGTSLWVLSSDTGLLQVYLPWQD